MPRFDFAPVFKSALPALVLGTTLLVSSAHADDVVEPSDGAVDLDEEFRCPADSPEFWAEVREAGWVGYGETWDLHTCDEGVEVFAEGASRRWKKMRPQLANGGLPRVMDAEDVEFYATVLPYGAFGSLGVIFVLAWLFALIQRRRAEPVEVVACPSCAVEIPIRPDEGGVFCPACGAATVLERGPARPALP